jgi:PAS domain S-box-containing protein
VVALIPEGRDITAQKNVEQALRQSEEKFSTAFRASPYSLTISEVESGRYLDINAGFERISGYTRDEVIGRTSMELGLWQDLAARDELVRRLREDGAVRGMEVNFLRKNGDVCVTRCSSELIELGGQMCILNAIEDITEQRQAEEAKRALEAQLRRVQKLEALGQLAGGIAHDFNNILSGVVAFTELALLDAHEPAAVREHLGEVQSAVGRAAELVRQILTFSRQQKQERRPIRLHFAMREALKLLRSSLPQTIEMEAVVESTAPTVLADSTQVHQLMMNLCTNAAHAMREEAGRLSVRLETVEVDAALERASPALRAGTYACLSVSDTGQGMDARTLQRIFEPFFTTKEPGEGTGLGLAVVHGIVEEHDAVITVDSVPGEGTTFRVFFPEHCELASEDDSEAPTLPRGAGERVLFIDDEQMICRSAEILLSRLGYRVTCYVDPALALSAFREGPDAVDLVITDMTMPRITGIELARQVLALRPKLPVLLSSGYTGSWTLEGVRAHGLSGLIAKPLAAAPLLDAIRAALSERR